MRTDGPTGMTKLIFTFLNFANSTKSGAKSRERRNCTCKKKTAVAQLCEALHYKPEGRWFDSDEVIGSFHLTNPSGRTSALGSTLRHGARALLC